MISELFTVIFFLLFRLFKDVEFNAVFSMYFI